MTFQSKSLVLAAALCLLTFILSTTVLPQLTYVVYCIIIGFSLISMLLYRNMKKANKINPRRFVSSFMGAIGIKLFASLIFLTFYLIFAEDQHKIPTVIALFFIYSAFNVLLLRTLTKELKNEGDPESTQ